MTADFIRRVPPTHQRLKFRGKQSNNPTEKGLRVLQHLSPASSSTRHQGYRYHRHGAACDSSGSDWKQSALLAVHSDASVQHSALQLRVCWLGSLAAHGSLHPLHSMGSV